MNAGNSQQYFYLDYSSSNLKLPIQTLSRFCIFKTYKLNDEIEMVRIKHPTETGISSWRNTNLHKTKTFA